MGPAESAGNKCASQRPRSHSESSESAEFFAPEGRRCGLCGLSLANLRFVVARILRRLSAISAILGFPNFPDRRRSKSGPLRGQEFPRNAVSSYDSRPRGAHMFTQNVRSTKRDICAIGENPGGCRAFSDFKQQYRHAQCGSACRVRIGMALSRVRWA